MFPAILIVENGNKAKRLRICLSSPKMKLLNLPTWQKTQSQTLSLHQYQKKTEKSVLFTSSKSASLQIGLRKLTAQYKKQPSR